MLDILTTFFSLKIVALIAAGTMAGIYVGAIPGLSVTMATAILISFTYPWDMTEALAVMVGVYCGGAYGGGRTSILLNIPGAPAAIATSFDGFPLAKKGKAGSAIGLTTTESVIGGLIGVTFLAFGAPIISELALKVSPRDYFILASLGLLMVSSLSGGSLSKGVFAVGMGILLGLVGMDTFTGIGRFTFGSTKLMVGINYIAALIGLFGISEAFYQVHNIYKNSTQQKLDRIIPSWRLVKKYMSLTMKCSVIGTIIGALPGVGGDISALFAYDYAKRSTKDPEVPFGEGAYEGVVAPETANNATIGGAFIPMLTLGIPGDAVTAVLIGALFIHGLKPGPMLMVDNPHILSFIVISLILANIFLWIFGMTGIKFFAKFTELPKNILLPVIIIVSVVGAYAITGYMSDVIWAVVFGLIGYILKMYGIPVGPIILGPLLDKSFRQAMLQANNSIGQFVLNYFSSPISIGLLIFLIFMIYQAYKFNARVGN